MVLLNSENSGLLIATVNALMVTCKSSCRRFFCANVNRQ